MTNHTIVCARTGAANAGPQCARNYLEVHAQVAQSAEADKLHRPWWLFGTKRRPFPLPPAYGFLRHTFFGPVRLSLRPGRNGVWLLQPHPNPDTRIDTAFDLVTLLDRSKVADRLAARGLLFHAESVRNHPDWRDWMLAVVAAQGGDAA